MVERYSERLREEELRGLREDKLKSIRPFAKFFGGDGRGVSWVLSANAWFQQVTLHALCQLSIRWLG
jgi:hypothetical protein